MSPLTKIAVTGPGAAAWLNAITSNRVSRRPGTVTYTLLLDDAGGVRSDITVACFTDEEFQIGANGPADVAWLRRELPTDGSVQVREITGALSCLGLWGPRSRDIISGLSDDDWSNAAFPYYSARQMSIAEIPVRALRVSYVGELGRELYTSPEYGGRLWEVLWKTGEPVGLIAAGRGAFDTLRLEKGYRLWGADMHTEYTPVEAGVQFAVKLSKENFRGHAALTRGERRADRRLCCLRLEDPQQVVMGKEPVLIGERVVGYVTSSGFGFSTGESLAYAYLPEENSSPESTVHVEYFGKRLAASVVNEPRWDPEGLRLRG
jgi:glycine cleavage system aminomethyltransferase T